VLIEEDFEMKQKQQEHHLSRHYFSYQIFFFLVLAMFAMALHFDRLPTTGT
jgi:hypothetical protein